METGSQGDWDAILEQRLKQWRNDGLARQLRLADGSGVRFVLDGKPVLSFASNDYLGLAADPRVVAAARAALERAGAGASASPLICGHKSIHAELEAALAQFKQSEAALVFPSGYQAALSCIGALAGPDESVILDRLAHASLLDGARLSEARMRTFKHNDAADLEHILKAERGRRCLVVVESLYSMDGDTAPLAEIIGLCERSGAMLLADEAHATGILGTHGRGALEEVSSSALPPHVIAMGTLSKALGSQGGFICARKSVIDTIVHAGRAYLFSTALSPASAGAALESLRIVAAEPQRRAKLMELAEHVRRELDRKGLKVLPSHGPIIPLLAGDEKHASAWSAALLKAGIFVPAVRYPTVKKGQARLRISISATHTESDCDELIRVCAGCVKQS